MNPASFKIDSPTPHQAAEDAEGYYAFLFPAFERGGQTYTPREFQDDLASGEVLLFRVWEGDEVKAVFLSRLQNTFRGKELYALAAAGSDAKEWVGAMMDTLAQVARETHCEAVVLDGRRGWEKMMKRLGYRVFQVRMRKEI